MLSFCNRQVVAMLCLVAGFAWSCAEKDTELPFPEAPPFIWANAIYNVRSDSFFKVRVDSSQKVNSAPSNENTGLIKSINVKLTWPGGIINDFVRTPFPYNIYDISTGSPVFKGIGNRYFYASKIVNPFQTGQTYRLELSKEGMPNMIAMATVRDTPKVVLTGQMDYDATNVNGAKSTLYSLKIKLPDTQNTRYYVIYTNKENISRPDLPRSSGVIESPTKPFGCDYYFGAWVVSVPPSITGEQVIQIPFYTIYQSLYAEISEVSIDFFNLYKSIHQNNNVNQFMPYSPIVSSFVTGKGIFELLNPTRIKLK